MSGTKTRLECMECGKRFARMVGPRTLEVKCPKCGGYDVDLDYSIPTRKAVKA